MSGPPKTPPVGLRMKALVEATGIPKSTILFYLRKGLLPEPLKTSPNMAYYPPGCIDRIRFIQYMQKRHRLSLNEIKEYLDRLAAGSNIASQSQMAQQELAQLRLGESVFGPDQSSEVLEVSDFCQATGLSPDQVNRLLGARLLLPLEDGRFDRQDILMGKAYATAFKWGIQSDDLTYYVELGEKIIEHEFALRRRVTDDLPFSDDIAVTLQMLENARLSRQYILERLFQHKVIILRDIKDG